MKGSILVIDSGAGGISTLKVLRKVLPYEDYIYFADNKNMPYGNKSLSRRKREGNNKKGFGGLCTQNGGACLQHSDGRGGKNFERGVSLPADSGNGARLQARGRKGRQNGGALYGGYGRKPFAKQQAVRT